MSLSKPDTFEDLQYCFTEHMRNPNIQNHNSGIFEPERLKVYSDLIYRNIDGLLASNFPVIRRISSDEKWHEMIRDYVANHHASTPLFPKMPQEFLAYLEHERDSKDDPKFLVELAHYEWMETSLANDQREIDLSEINVNRNLLDGIPVLNPISLPVAYTWPVHQINQDFIPSKAPDEPSYIIIYRDLNYEIGFLALNSVSAKLIEYIHNNQHQRTGLQILHCIADELSYSDMQKFTQGGLEIMLDMQKREVLLGTKQ